MAENDSVQMDDFDRQDFAHIGATEEDIQEQLRLRVSHVRKRVDILVGRVENVEKAGAETSPTPPAAPHALATEVQINKAEQDVRNLWENGCGCTKKCTTKFAVDDVASVARQLRSRGLVERREFIEFGAWIITASGKRPHFMLRGEEVCRAVFATVLSSSVRTIFSATKAAGDHPNIIWEEPEEERRGRPAEKEKLDVAMTFFENFASANAMPDPAKVSGSNGRPRILLPSAYTIEGIYAEFAKLAIQAEKPLISRAGFYNMRHEHFPHVITVGPRSDLCDTCQKLRDQITNADNETLVDGHTQRWRDHLQVAKDVRKTYQRHQLEAARSFTDAPVDYQEYMFKRLQWDQRTPAALADDEWCTRDDTLLISCDFAEEVSVPYSSDQRGTIYFSTPLRVHVFGVVNENIGHMTLFLFDEGETSSKDADEEAAASTSGGVSKKGRLGADAVVTMLFEYLCTRSAGQKHLRVQMDNCTGQNKNRTVMQFFAWLVATGRFESVLVDFMIPGHTKFRPDAFFGVFKSKYRRALAIDTLQELGEVATKGTTYTAVHFRGKSVPVPFGYQWRLWSLHFDSLAKIKGIGAYRTFSFHKDEPWKVTMTEEWGENPTLTSANLQGTSKFEVEKFAPPAPAANDFAMTRARRMFLYKNVRQYIRKYTKRDQTCPHPDGPDAAAKEADEDGNPRPRKRGRPTLTTKAVPVEPTIESIEQKRVLETVYRQSLGARKGEKAMWRRQCSKLIDYAMGEIAKLQDTSILTRPTVDAWFTWRKSKAGRQQNP